MLSRRRASAIGRLLLLALLMWAAWRSINYISGTEPGPDSSAYMSMALHVRAGRVAYRDVWDHKPPMVYALDYVALALGGPGVNSVRVLERVFAIAGVVAFFATAHLAFRRFWLAYLASVLYLLHFYALYVFEGGNLTEEYGAIFSLAGMAAAVASLRCSGRRSLVFGGLAGVAFSAAVLSKEPYLLLVPPWFLCVAWPRQADVRGALTRAGIFAFGAALPFLLFLGYLLAHGAWADWMDVVAFNFSNRTGDTGFRHILVMADTEVFRTLLITRVAAVLGLVGLLRWAFVRETRGLALVIASSAVLCLLATGLSGRYYGHYYLQLVPSYVLLGASGAAFVVWLVSRSPRWVPVAMAAVLLLLAVDARAFKDFVLRLEQPPRRWHADWLSDIVRANTPPGEAIWAPWRPLLYTDTGRLSPTKWHFVFDHLFIDTSRSTGRERLETLRSDLEQHPPRVIVLNAPPGATRADAEAFLARSGLAGWIAENYWTAVGARDKPLQVLVLKGPWRLSGAWPPR